ncbi:MAG: N-acetyltransferase [Calditrichaeota bacterium]|nr:MAG: N-acetyltransferase [Calditrichota bacterium]
MILVETDRLFIRTFSLQNIPDYAKIVADSEVVRFLGNGKTQTYKEAQDYILNCIKNYSELGWSRFAVETKETSELIGFCGFANYNNEIDFGWRYSPKFWNQGFGTEAAKAVLEMGINKFKFPRIVSIAYPQNIGSIRIIEKIGMQFERKIEINQKELLQFVKEN